MNKFVGPNERKLYRPFEVYDQDGTIVAQCTDPLDAFAVLQRYPEGAAMRWLTGIMWLNGQETVYAQGEALRLILETRKEKWRSRLFPNDEVTVSNG